MADSKLTLDAVRHVAKLARLDLTGRDVLPVGKPFVSKS